MPSSHRRYFKELLNQHDQPSENLCRANVCVRNQNISVGNYCSKQSLNINLNIPTTRIGSIEMPTPKIDWFMKDIQSSNSTDYLRDCIISSTAIAVSDGLFSPLEKVGGCAWIVSTQDGTEWIQGGGVVPGEEHEQNSYRSELGGALGVAVIIDCIQLPDPSPLSKYKISTVVMECQPCKLLILLQIT